MTTRGEQPRPRVAIVGQWDSAIVESLKGLFPTVHDWTGRRQVDRHGSEVDLILAYKTEGKVIDARLIRCHSILFGAYPFQGFQADPAKSVSTCKTQTFTLPQTSPSLHALRELTLGDDARNWPVLTASLAEDQGAFDAGALALSTVPAKGVLATVCVRPSTGTGLAWLPWEPAHVRAWVTAIMAEWAQHDEKAFATVRPWREGWLTREEACLVRRRAELQADRERALAAADKAMAEVDVGLLEARHAGDLGWRSMLTAQEEPLVSIVTMALQALGFRVENRDLVNPKGGLREDLRVCLDEVPGWEAVVEIKGFRRSGGSSEDLRKLERHVKRYRDEKDRWPNARWFVVNGQFETAPAARHRAFASAPDVLRDFGHDDGLVIGTVDLFRAIVDDPARFGEIRTLLVEGRGEFRWPRQPPDAPGGEPP
ncbi:MAG: hypothetical protein Q8P18_16205 [Pseudomonadota bacterium]|nr:hypothetical protein [Pseudomonadota bacterium]